MTERKLETIEQAEKLPYFDPWEAITLFKEMLSSLSVEALYVQHHDWGFLTWVIVNNSTLEERYQIYECQWELMQRYPDIGFRFNLLDRMGKPLSEFVTLNNFKLVFQVEEQGYATGAKP